MNNISSIFTMYQFQFDFSILDTRFLGEMASLPSKTLAEGSSGLLSQTPTLTYLVLRFRIGKGLVDGWKVLVHQLAHGHIPGFG